MATLYLARHAGAEGFSRMVAIKVIRPEIAVDTAFASMLIDEAKICANIRHPNIVYVEELAQEDERFYMAMEYVHGCSLGELMRAVCREGGRVAVELATYIAIEIAKGLHAAHEAKDGSGDPLNIVHRDISPQNILISFDGHVKLIDFGIAKARGRIQQTQTGYLKGKLRYMAPEQARAGEIDRRADLYALGIVFWEMLTGRRLFDADSDLGVLKLVRNPKVVPPSHFVSEVPADLDAAAMQALATDVADRHQDAKALRRALARALPAVASVEPEDLAELVREALPERKKRADEQLQLVRQHVQGPRPGPASEEELSRAPRGSSTDVEVDLASIDGLVNTNASTLPSAPPGDGTYAVTRTSRHRANPGPARWWFAATVLSMAALGVTVALLLNTSTPTPQPSPTEPRPAATAVEEPNTSVATAAQSASTPPDAGSAAVQQPAATPPPNTGRPARPTGSRPRTQPAPSMEREPFIVREY